MIDVSDTDGHLQLTLNRPEKANALTQDMLEALIGSVESASKGTKVLSITGTGRVFSAGADLDAARQGLATSPLWEQLSSTIAALPFLTIAALNGSLAGGAFGMALACDIRIAVPDSKFFYPVAKHGFLPQPSDPGRMALLIGPSRTKLILMTGMTIKSQTALDWGLVDQIAARDDLDMAVQQCAEASLTGDAANIAAIKSMIAAH